jgi:hypothetical protein
MRKKRAWIFWYAAVVLLTAGCEAPLLLVGAVGGGTGAGTYMYIDGGLQSDYRYSYDMVWAACEKTMAGMRAVNVQPLKEIGMGYISALINDEKVRFDVKYKERNVTTVTVRVGFFGNKTASLLLHDKIYDNISKN